MLWSQRGYELISVGKGGPNDCDNMDKINDSHLQFLTQHWQLTTPFAKASDIAVLYIWSLFSAVVTTVSRYELCQRSVNHLEYVELTNEYNDIYIIAVSTIAFDI